MTLVRRRLVRLRGGARRRAGGGRADGAGRRGRRAAAEARTGGDPRSSWPGGSGTARRWTPSGGRPRSSRASASGPAQESAGKLRDLHEDRLDEARERLRGGRGGGPRRRRDPRRPAAHRRARGPHRAQPDVRCSPRYGACARPTSIVQGPERIALVGPQRCRQDHAAAHARRRARTAVRARPGRACRCGSCRSGWTCWTTS